MQPSLKCFLTAALFAVFATICLGAPGIVRAASDEPAKAPHSAFNKVDREDLEALVQEANEVRIIVGIHAPEIAEKRRNRSADSVIEQDVATHQGRLLNRMRAHNVRHVKSFRLHAFVAMTVDAAGLDAVLADPEVESVAEDQPVYLVLYDTPGITRADDAWLAGFRGAGQVVAVIDTGVDKSHPFFTGKVVAEACFSNPVSGGTSSCPNGASQQIGPGAGVPCPDINLGCWHGTHVAGIAVGRYGVLSSTTGGIAPDAGLIAIQVFQRVCANGSCSLSAYDSDIGLALEHVYALRTTYSTAAINMSLGGNAFTAPCDNVSPALTTIISNLRDANIATIIAAGNGARIDAISFPACISSAVSVGATTKQNVIASFSNSASFLSLLAPGVSVTSAYPGGYATASGTSMATPHVAGAWAVLRSANPGASVDEVLDALQATGIPIIDPRNGITKSLIQIGDKTSGALAPLWTVPPTVALTAPVNGTSYTAPASLQLSATAADTDGSIAKVEFFAGTTQVGEALTPPYTFTWSGVPAGSYTLTARATDNLGAQTTSSPVTVTVTPSAIAPVNVAAPAQGGSASASSTYAAGYAASGVTNGDHKGTPWGNGGGWNDGTPNTFPDWLQITFNGLQSISEIDVFMVQDNYTAPVEPTAALTFSLYGLVDFEVQYWTGSAWVPVPGGTVVGNNKVWRRFTFAPLSTDRIRVFVTQALGTWSRITEVEAWAYPNALPNVPPTVALTAPVNGASYTAPASLQLSATAADADGSIARVEFFAGPTEVGEALTPPYTFTWSGVPAGTYTLTARATDNLGAQTTSSPVTVTVTSSVPVNVAAAAQGGSAAASSTYGTGYAPAGVINGDHKGTPWGNGGGWNDGTPNTFPDWLQITFNGLQSISEIDVFMVQDNYTAPVEPTAALTFSLYGLVDFEVQYWTGSAWVAVPGGTVVGNNKVWRRFTFAPLSTDRIRVFVTQALGTWSRITEVEAWAYPNALPNVPPTVALTAPVNGASYTAPASLQLSATAADADGSIAGVEFFAGSTEVGEVLTPPYTVTWSGVPAGSYTLTARATDNLGAQTTSSPVTITVTPSAIAPVNVAAAVQGGSAAASSTYGTGYAPAGVLNGDRKGTPWGNGAGWNDSTLNTFPDWLQVTFTGLQTLSEIDVFMVQDNYTAPVEPTAAMTFSLYGLVDFEVQYWTGSAWAAVPGGTVVGNTKVWRRFTFAPLTTDRIRVFVTQALGSWSRLTEVEAWAYPSP